jgi:hypothetical protein
MVNQPVDGGHRGHWVYELAPSRGIEPRFTRTVGTCLYPLVDYERTKLRQCNRSYVLLHS